MKVSLNIIMLLVMLLPAIALAGEDEQITKEKKISKAYYVNSNAGLQVNNQYGQIYVTTWDEDKTAIDVVIRVSAKNEEIVDRRINSVNIDIDALKSLVKIKTSIGNFSGRNVTMEINYTIKIPRNGSVNLDNQYGSIKLGTINGEAVVKCQYGDVYADQLNNVMNNLKLEYSGNTKINYMKAGDIKAAYSVVKLTKGNTLKFNSEYTQLNVTDINDINYRSDYGDIKIQNGGKISGNCNYTNQRILNLSGQLNLTTNYGDIKIERVEKDTKNIAINSTYTNVVLHYDEGYAFDFEYQLQYGNLNGAAGLKFTERREKDFEASYKGYHKNSGENRMFIKAEYGNINLSRL